jgi:hypothetical protein
MELWTNKWFHDELTFEQLFSKDAQNWCSTSTKVWQHERKMKKEKISIYEGRLFVCLFWFVSYLWGPLDWDASNRVLGLFGKLSRRRGAWAWFHGVWTCSAKVLEYWMSFSLKIKLNCIWKLQRNWNVPLVSLERSWWVGFNGIYLVRFGFKM